MGLQYHCMVPGGSNEHWPQEYGSKSNVSPHKYTKMNRSFTPLTLGVCLLARQKQLNKCMFMILEATRMHTV